jgi:hypothetical protein
MSQVFVFAGTKSFGCCKNTAYGWGKVFSPQQAIGVDAFINEFKFDNRLPHHSQENTPKKGAVVTSIKRNIFFWIGSHKREIEDFLSASKYENGYSTTRMDKQGNTFTCFAVSIEHTHICKTNIATMQVRLCLCQVNSMAAAYMPLDFANLPSTKKIFPKWHDAIAVYAK